GYYEGIRPRLYACPEARQALRLSYHPPVSGSLLPLRVIVPPGKTLAFATLPRWARRMYGAPGSPPGDLAATAALRAARRAAAGLPGRLLYEPTVRWIFSAARRPSGPVTSAAASQRSPAIVPESSIPAMSTAAALDRVAELADRPGPR